MVDQSSSGLLPEELPSVEERKQIIADLWLGWSMGGDAGATTWEVLERLQDLVTQCLALSPPDIARAENLTAKALLLMEGLLEC